MSRKRNLKNGVIIWSLLLLLIGGLGCQSPKRSIQKEVVQLTALENLYTIGQYCALLPKAQNYLKQQASNTLDWQSAKVLEGLAFLELEEWTKVTKWLENIQPLIAAWSPKARLQVDLIHARLLEKTEQLATAELAYQTLFQNIKTNEEAGAFLLPEAMAYYGNFQYNVGNYKAAKKSITPLTTHSGTVSPDVAKAISTLANLSNQQSQSLLAEQYLLQTKAILEKPQYSKHPTYALFLNDYALHYLEKGQFEVADSLLTLSSKIIKETCPIPSVLGYNLSAKANLQKALGKYDLATQYFKETIAAFEKIEQHGEIAIATFQLGTVYFAIDSLEQATAQYGVALAQLDKFVGEKKHIYKATILQGMAALEVYNWNYTVADSLYQMSIPIIKETLGEESTAYATILNNLAGNKEAEEDFDAALALYLETANLDTLLQSKYHPNYLNTLFNTARCYSKMKNSEQALNYYQQGVDLQLQLLNDYFGNFSETTRLAYRLRAMGNFDVFNTYATATNQPAYPTLIENINLATKNRVLDYTVQTKQSTLQSADTVVKKRYEEWLKQKTLLTNLYLKSEADRQLLGLSIDSIQQLSNELEKELTRYAKQQISGNQLLDVSDVQAKLKPQEAAIDYFNFVVADEYGPFPDSIFYYAIIIRPEWALPKLVKLLDQKELQEILSYTANYTLSAEVNHLLYQKIWQPLEVHLEGVKNIHVSPDGLLHQISFAGLFPDAETDAVLLNKYQFNYYSNLGDLDQEKATAISTNSVILLMANIDYNADMINIDAASNQYFTSLSGTTEELELLQRNKALSEYQLQIFQEQAATEIKLKEAITSTKPSIIHLATHGYFLAKEEVITATKTLGDRIRTADNAFLRSGLVFSGVNKRWIDSTSIAPEKDGILTALEVANLNLSATDLVVLSACNTGRGDVTDGEGVFGLQRAFKMAGAQHILVSLWKIPDTQTAELMNYFYTFLAAKKPPTEALVLAQKEMQKEYPSPFDWAGFVLFE